MLTKDEYMIPASVPCKSSCLRVPVAALMPEIRCGVVDPGFVCCREENHPKGMALVLIGIAHSIGNCQILAPGKLNSMSCDPLRRVALRFPADALSAFILANPEYRVVELRHSIGRCAASLDITSRDDIEDATAARIVIDNAGLCSANSYFPMVNNHRGNQIREHGSLHHCRANPTRCVEHVGNEDAVIVLDQCEKEP